MIVEIPRYLKHGREDNDRRNFEQWANKQISTKVALGRFKKNNRIEDEVAIQEGDFETWVRSLGYDRPKI